MDNIKFVVNGQEVASENINFQNGQTLGDLITIINEKVLDLKKSQNLDESLVMFHLTSTGLNIDNENMLLLPHERKLPFENSPTFQVTMMNMNMGGSRRKRRSRKSRRFKKSRKSRR